MIAEPSTPPAPVARARRASRFAALASAAVLALAGCGAGQISETSRQHPTVGGSNADLGRIALRNMQIEAPQTSGWAEGDTVALTMTIVNNTSAAEDLVDIATEAADEVLIFSGSAEYLAYLASLAPSTAAPAPFSTSSPSLSANPSVSNTGVTAEPTPTAAGATETPTGANPNPNQSVDPSATTGSAAPTPISAQTPTPISAPAGVVTVPSNSAVEFGYGTADRPVILLVGLTAPIAGGSVIDMDFTFSTAGSVTAPVPVMLTPGGHSDSPTLDLHHGAEEATEEEN